ncbi:MAG: hypothetical protein IJ661_01530 [Lachnospiraceae bacterium]|nr:hypothetical protein [Lachnospiraceae bacterium]
MGVKIDNGISAAGNSIYSSKLGTNRIQISDDNISETLTFPDDAVLMNISQEGKMKVEDSSAIDKYIKHFDKSLNHMPEYCGDFNIDKTIASALENCSKEEQAFAYDIIRKNFLVKNTNGMTEDERQANISLGMKKAEYAAESFISEDNRQSFMNAMEAIAKMASAGKTDENGNVDYGLRKASYLGHGSGLVYTTNDEDVMRVMAPEAYAEYQRLAKENTADAGRNAQRYQAMWYAQAVTNDPTMIERYEQRFKDNIARIISGQKIDSTFNHIKTDSKTSFIEGLMAFQSGKQGFLENVIRAEIGQKFWR